MNENNFALVIEDSVSMRQYVSAILRQGMRIDRILEAENPDHALQLLSQQHGHLSLIVSDWNMPGMPLQLFMKNIRARPELAEATVLLLTASCLDKAGRLAKAIHADAVLTKPFSADALLDLLEAHLDITERRRAKRVMPLTKCDVDLGFEQGSSFYRADIINVSETGILLRAPNSIRGAGYVYDFASLVLHLGDGEGIRLYGQIVRLEADKQAVDNGGNTVLLAIEFRNMGEGNRRQLLHYIGLNDEDGKRQAH